MLSEIQTAIVDRLTPDLPGVACAAYPKLARKITIPAALVELDELEPGNFGVDEFGVAARFIVYCIVDHTAANAEIDVRNLAMKVAARVWQEETFGVDSVRSRVEIIRIGEDSINPDLEGYLVWSVEFEIGLVVGETEWNLNPVAGADVTTIVIGDLDGADITHTIADGLEPETVDKIDLPDQPKG